ncbi:MAG TPA: hypothetical protein VF479_05190, partial [Pseudolysinimonas sp.]
MDARQIQAGSGLPGATVVAVGLMAILFGILAMGLGTVGAVQGMHDPFNACQVSALAPGSVPIDGPVVDWDYGWFPMGLRCGWDLDGTIIWTSLTPDYFATVIFYAGIILIVSGLS